MFFFTQLAVAVSTDNITNLRGQALNALKRLNPNTLLPHFNEAPSESQLKPNEINGNQVLLQESMKRLSQDETAAFITKEEHQRAKITPNNKVSEIQEGERIIENAEGVIRPGCHKEPVPCEEKSIEKTCEENRHMSSLTCAKKLSVRVTGINQSEISRFFVKTQPTIDLTQCKKQDIYCTDKQELKLHPTCAHLKVNITFNNQSLRLTKWPTCQDPTLTIAENNIPQLFKTKIAVTEYIVTDKWDGDDCDTHNRNTCVQESPNICLEPNQTKVIDGIEITRRCWGEARKYQCLGDVVTTCTPWIDSGCSNIRAECLSKIGDYCILTAKVFQCVERTYFPDKEVCPAEAVPCANGSCDHSIAEESDDVNEGISRLGTVADTANEVAVNQVQSHSPAIFKGQSQECEKYILNLRDCCTDDGLLEDFIHCPVEMQALQKAKLEHRTIYLGHYKHHALGTTRYVYCVFPTKLSGIVQIQGRFNQLHIPFGEAEKPNCRGITPEELERIDFKQLDIHDMVDELVSQKVIPQSDSITNANESHVKALEDKGVPYDK